jgi:hypothetical protein
MVASVDEFGWDQEARRTMLESDQFRSALGTRHELELRQQLRAAQAATERASHHVLYNATNPFDSTFADDLSDDSVHKWPCQIESNHQDGCYMIFDWRTQQERFAALFPAPFSVLEDISVVVI